MIGLPQRLPHVIWKNRRLVPLSESWLAESIYQSAAHVGCNNWQLAEHVAHAVAAYLESNCGAPALSVRSLEAIVRKSLVSVGYPEVADASHLVAPRVSIFLPEIARRAEGCALVFFPDLKARILEAFQLQVRGIRLTGLRDCSKILMARRRWRERSRRMGEEIIDFSRTVLTQVSDAPTELLIAS